MRNIIVCNDKGGVGKTLVTHLLALVLLDQHEPFRIIECEKMPRLRKLFGDLVDYRPIERQKVSEIYENPDILFTYWDEIAEKLQDRKRSLVDMGAGVTFPFCRWAQASGRELLNNGANLTILIVTTAEQESWRTASNNAHVLRELFPEAEFMAIYNQRDGKFFGHSVGPFPGVPLKAVRIPAWPYLQNAGRFDELVQRPSREVARTCDIPLGTAARSMYAFADWLLDSTDQLAPVLGEEIAAIPQSPQLVRS
ncbi:hypothetical protein [Rhodovibrio salinarum]|uniref:CobQ/CobB/MinD/ParA nucleotide binding domain-containing protein n=1 Tax=Rhodovibrio salinarum TaxID=1087 RepID=A0A934QJY0_9PROT|nr:hypothetical protein [Rhodovibrio salinarum]MBK1698498.1 hypothetical protein [Rhodovibrio salinarum]